MKTIWEQIKGFFKSKKNLPEKSQEKTTGIQKVKMDGTPYTLFDFKFGHPYKFIDENGKDL